MDLAAGIAQKVGSREPAEVEELILDSCRATKVSGLDQFTNLKVLLLNGCGLTTLDDFPTLSKLKCLELSDNKLSDGLEELQNCGLFELRRLSLANNKFATLDALIPLQSLPALRDLDLFNCAVGEVENYRDELFDMLPELKYLDGYDRDGNEKDDDDDDDDDDGDDDDGDDDLLSSEVGEEDDLGEEDVSGSQSQPLNPTLSIPPSQSQPSSLSHARARPSPACASLSHAVGSGRPHGRTCSRARPRSSARATPLAPDLARAHLARSMRTRCSATWQDLGEEGDLDDDLGEEGEEAYGEDDEDDLGEEGEEGDDLGPEGEEDGDDGEEDDEAEPVPSSKRQRR